MKTPEQIAEQNGWDGYNSIVDLRDIADVQTDAWNEALETAAREVRALSHGLDCSCDGCAARGNDAVTILEQRIAATQSAVRSSELDLPLQETVQYAAYILNHYSRSSPADHLCLARDLERHGWSLVGKTLPPATKQQIAIVRRITEILGKCGWKSRQLNV